MKKSSLLLYFLAVLIFSVGCAGSSSSDSIAGSTATDTTRNLSLNASLGSGNTAASLRAATLNSSSFKFRVKALSGGEAVGNWVEIAASANAEGNLAAQATVSNTYAEYITELVFSNNTVLLAAIQNVVSTANTTITANPESTARRITFEKWKLQKNPSARTYDDFLQNLTAGQNTSLTIAATAFSSNLASYVSYLAGETPIAVESFYQEFCDGTSLSPEAAGCFSNLETLATTVGTGTSTSTGTSTGTSTDTIYNIAATSLWPAISGINSSLAEVGKTAPHIFTADETDTAYNSANAVIITLNDASTTVSGSGAAYNGGIVTISKTGTYIISGTLAGHIFVSGKIADGVTLVLNGVTINGKTHAAIFSEKKSTPVTVILGAGTTNTLSDAASYTYFADDEPGACLFVKGDLLIKGTGTLTINGKSSENGIQSKGETDGLVITSGAINVTAGGNGIKGKKIAISGGSFNISVTDEGECIEASETSLYIAGGSFTLDSAGGDAIKAENDWEEDATITPDGDICITGGNFNLVAFGDGIQATDELVICGGTFTIRTTNTGFEATDASSKGIKTGTDKTDGSMTIAGGDFNFTTTDHAIKSKGKVDVIGQPAIRAYSSLGKGISGTGNVTIGKTGNPQIQITYAEEGLESKQILSIEGGTVRLNTWDDGINAGGEANDGKTHLINISGGYTYILAKGDGIDSNGNVTVSGGTLIVNANTQGNSAIDTDQGTFSFTGGTVIAAGPSEMACAPASAYSTQPSLSINFSTLVAAGKLVHIEGADGTQLLSFFPAQQSSSLVFCSGTLAKGNTYNIYTGGSHNGTSLDGVFTGGSYSRGTLYQTVTQTYMTTEVGTKANGGPGGIGGGNFGGPYTPPPNW